MRLFKGVIKSVRGFFLDSRDNYSWELPRRVRGPVASFLSSRVNKVQMDSYQEGILKSLPEKACVVFISKEKSQVERLIAYFKYLRTGLFPPLIGLGYSTWWLIPLGALLRVIAWHIDHLLHFRRLPDPFKGSYLLEKVKEGQNFFASLIDEKEFYWQRVKAKSDPIQRLIETQKESEREIFLVPQLVFYRQKSISHVAPYANPLVGYHSRPGAIRRIWRLITRPGDIFIELSRPVNLMAFLEENRGIDAADLAIVLRRSLLKQITRHRQSITGPLLKSPEEIKQLILTRRRLQGFMKEYARRRSMSAGEVVKEAIKYIDEIAARPKALFISLGFRVVDHILKGMFEAVSVNKEGIRAAKEASVNGPLVFIPCHKSHVDYMVLSTTLMHNSMPCPHTFAGKNLAFWPMGILMRWGGAFFVRRSFKGAVFYTKIFAEYIYLLISQGYNIQVFIEGTRSRTGKLLLPKLGMLSTLLNAIKEGAEKDLVFLPVYIGYDRVPEDSSYLKELNGGKKEPESFVQMLRARRLLKKKFGRIYIQFCEPLSLSLLSHQETGKEVSQLTSKELNRLSRKIGEKVLSSISANSVVTPQALVSAALLNTPGKIFTKSKIDFMIETYLIYLANRKAPLAESLMISPQHACRHIISYYIQNRCLKVVSGVMDDPSSTYLLNESKRLYMDYYKNNCIGHFVMAAYTALAILASDSFHFSSDALQPDILFLEEIFEQEFGYDREFTMEVRIRKTIKAFIDDAILVPHPTLPDTYDLTSLGLKKLKGFAAFILPFIESYIVVVSFLAENGKKEFRPQKDLVKIRRTGNRMLKQGQIRLKEAISDANFNNAIDFFKKKRILTESKRAGGFLKRLSDFARLFE